MPTRLPAPVGERFGRLVVVEEAEPKRVSGKSMRMWRCRCDCGQEKDIRSTNVGKSTFSCGCMRDERVRDASTRHGGARHSGKRHPLYSTWRGMRQRCNNPNSISYPWYGGDSERPISVCDRWGDFAAFVEDMGEKPTPKHTLDRIDGAKGYEPSNCKWSSPDEQAANRRPKRKAG